MKSLGEELKAIADKVINDRDQAQELMESELRGLFFDFLNDWIRDSGDPRMRDAANNGERKIEFFVSEPFGEQEQELQTKADPVVSRYKGKINRLMIFGFQKDAWKHWADNNNLHIYFPYDCGEAVEEEEVIISW